MSLLRDMNERLSPKVETSRRPLCDAARLLSNVDFINLYGDERSPVALRIAELERSVRDTSVTDPAQMMALKGELKGFTSVRSMLSDLARMQEAELSTAQTAEPRRGLLPVKPS